MSPIRFERALLLLCLATVLSPAAAPGQETVLALEFSFSNPGARSMGFGGAFAGLADDATAAFANPAGLVQLVDSEVSVEGRSWRYATPFTAGGRLFGEPTGIGLDDTAGLRIAESEEVVNGLSFLSFVYPRGRWSLAIYRHQLADFEFFGETQGLFRGFPEGPPRARERFPDQRSTTEFEITTHGLAVACRVHDRLSLGLGIGHFESRLLATSGRYGPPNISDPNPYLPSTLEILTTMAIDSTDRAWNAGLLWKVAEQWQLGAFFRQGPEFEIAIDVRTGAALPPAGTLLGSGASPVSMPDIYGLGLAYRSPGGAFTAAFEWDRVEYATIVDSLDPTRIPVTIALDDGDEFHLGGEYVFARSTPLLALRAGVWLDPDHRLRALDGQDVVVRALRQGGDDEIHLAAGVGLVFKRVEIDLGVDFSQLVDTASVSAIYSF